MTEKQLWQRFKEGSEEAFSSIYHTHYNVLYNYLNKIGRDENLSNDCIQDLFFKLWRDREKLGDVQSIKFYLLTSARRAILKKIKKERAFDKKIKAAGYHETDITFAQEELLIQDEEADELKKKIADLLNSLPKRQKEAIYLKYYEGLSYDEVAELMEVNYQSVVNLIYKAFQAFKKHDLLQSLKHWYILLLLRHLFQQ